MFLHPQRCRFKELTHGRRWIRNLRPFMGVGSRNQLLSAVDVCTFVRDDGLEHHSRAHFGILWGIFDRRSQAADHTLKSLSMTVNISKISG